MNTQTNHLSQSAQPGHKATRTAPPAASGANGLRSAGTSGKRLKQAQNAAEAQELLGLPAQVVGGLPAPVALRLHVPGTPVPVVLWTGRISPEARRATPVLADMIVFDGAELEAIVCACEADRLWHADFLGLCFEKWRRPEVPVRAAELLDGANADENASWTFGRVLTRLGLEVEMMELDEREPVARSLYEAA